MEDIKLFGLNLLSYVIIGVGILWTMSAYLSAAFTGAMWPVWLGIFVIIIGAYLRFKVKRRLGIFVWHR